jgi:hypothetical protein
MTARYILVSQITTRLSKPSFWHIAKRGVGPNPTYYILATTKSEEHARVLLEALLSTLANKE